MKKIAYLMPTFPVYSEGFIGTEIRAMESLGYELCLLAFEKSVTYVQPQDKIFIDRTYYLNQYDLDSPLSVLIKCPKVWNKLTFILKQKSIAKYSLLYSALKIVSLIKKLKCDHIHAHFAQASAANAIAAAHLAGISVSFVGHGHDIYEFPFDLTLKLNYSDLVIAVCQNVYDDFKKLAPSANVALVHCGIEPLRFTHKPLLRYQHFKERKRLLFIGRLVETKGVDDIIRAMILIPEYDRPRIDIVGDGPLYRQLVTSVKQHHLEHKIIFLGLQLNDWFINNAHDYLAMICPFKESSTGNRDTGPVVVKEAMALGLPVISTYFMGCNEMITEKTGLRVNPADTVALSKAIVQMMTLSENDWLMMSQAAHKRVNDYFTSFKQAQLLSESIEQL